MITPTVGRVVWYYDPNLSGQVRVGPLAAVIAFVHSDSLVNLMVIGTSGISMSRASVPLLQDGDPVPDSNYCEWMPYQKGQAAKVEALEKQISP